MRVRTYAIVLRAVEEGSTVGWNRAHKHVDNPKEHEILQHIQQGIMSELCEVFEFADEEPGGFTKQDLERIARKLLLEKVAKALKSDDDEEAE